jgi:hypothetical protein
MSRMRRNGAASSGTDQDGGASSRAQGIVRRQNDYYASVMSVYASVMSVAAIVTFRCPRARAEPACARRTTKPFPRAKRR